MAKATKGKQLHQLTQRQAGAAAQQQQQQRQQRQQPLRRMALQDQPISDA
jgi:hypothetical protein